MSDLTRFNLKAHGFSVTTSQVRTSCDSWDVFVTVFNLADLCAFNYPSTFATCEDEAKALFKKGVVDLTKSSNSDFCEYTQQSDIDDGYTNTIYSYTAAPVVEMEEEGGEGYHYDEDGTIAHGEMLERQAQEWADSEGDYRYQ